MESGYWVRISYLVTSRIIYMVNTQCENKRTYFFGIFSFA